MRLTIRCGIAISLCLALSFGFRTVPQLGAHASIPLAAHVQRSIPPGSLRLYRTSANGGTLQALDPLSLSDLSAHVFHTGLRIPANQYPVIVATSDGSRFAEMYNAHPNRGVIRAQDQILELFDARSGKPISAPHHPAVPVWIRGISADGSVVYGFSAIIDPNLACASTNPFYLLDAHTGKAIRHLAIAASPWDSVVVSPNLQRLYTMTASDHINRCGPQWSYVPTITAYSLETDGVVRALRLKGILAGRWETSRTINGDPIGGDWNPGFALSPDGSQLAILDGHSATLTMLDSRSLQIAGTEQLSQPQTGLQSFAALLGLQPDTAEAKGQWNGTTLQMQYTADGRSLLVTGAALSPDKRHRYASSRSLGIKLIDIAGGQIRAWLDDRKQVLSLWPAPDGSAVYSAIQTWSRSGGWVTTLRRHDPATLQVGAHRTFLHMGNWWLNLFFLQAQH
jgi:hypothetical protein